MQLPQTREKAIQTWRNKYGVDNPRQSAEIAAKIKNTCLDKYGVEYVVQSAIVRERAFITKCIRHTFNTSNVEDALYDMLCDIFSAFNVVRQYKSSVYPFACDFYIKPRNLYIELNASWTHGLHWFGSGCGDLERLSKWQDMSISSNYYAAAVETWVERDVVKRDMAALNNLNYVVFWDNGLRDARLWFLLGCPCGQDWLREYSWMNDEQLAEFRSILKY